jgi:hypothetical protein
MLIPFELVNALAPKPGAPVGLPLRAGFAGLVKKFFLIHGSAPPSSPCFVLAVLGLLALVSLDRLKGNTILKIVYRSQAMFRRSQC